MRSLHLETRTIDAQLGQVPPSRTARRVTYSGSKRINRMPSTSPSERQAERSRRYRRANCAKHRTFRTWAHEIERATDRRRGVSDTYKQSLEKGATIPVQSPMDGDAVER